MKTPILALGLAWAALFMSSCGDNQQQLPQGAFVGHLILNDSAGLDLPFNIGMKLEQGQYLWEITNADEKIVVEDIRVHEDSMWVYMPVFESKFVLKYKADSLWGYWEKYQSAKRRIDFYALPETNRFVSENEPTQVIDGTFAMTFSPQDSNEAYPAIGLFQQEGHRLTGTIITETGDYRYLEGIMDGDEFSLSTFDGAHAFLFEGHWDELEQWHGTFYSGKHWSEPFIAYADEDAQLASPDQLTYLKPGYDAFDFSFPDTTGQMVSMNDFQGKPVIVQILGSWCPNCMDETAYYVQLKNQFPELQIVGLAYERSNVLEEAKPAMRKMMQDLKVNYPILLAGTWSKKEAAESLPMLNHVMSFPTSIFIDAKGEIRRIHTGFYGPGTGQYFENYRLETEQLIEEMLGES